MGFCESELGRRVVQKHDPRGPAGSKINYEGEKMLNQRLSTMELKHFEYNDFMKDPTTVQATMMHKVPQYMQNKQLQHFNSTDNLN